MKGACLHFTGTVKNIIKDLFEGIDFSQKDVYVQYWESYGENDAAQILNENTHLAPCEIKDILLTNEDIYPEFAEIFVLDKDKKATNVYYYKDFVKSSYELSIIFIDYRNIEICCKNEKVINLILENFKKTTLENKRVECFDKINKKAVLKAWRSKNEINIWDLQSSKRVFNKSWYFVGNPFKIKLRKHFCHKCKTELSTIKHSKVVDQNSEEAKYYDFSIGSGKMIGSCEFIHKLFYCQKCSRSIEYVTQTSLEDAEIVIQRVKNYFLKKGVSISIEKTYKKRDGSVMESVDDFESVEFLVLKVTKGIVQKEISYKKQNKAYYERPGYFKVTKRALIKLIANA